jgi:hypothetical protein
VALCTRHVEINGGQLSVVLLVAPRGSGSKGKLHQKHGRDEEHNLRLPILSLKLLDVGTKKRIVYPTPSETEVGVLGEKGSGPVVYLGGGRVELLLKLDAYRHVDSYRMSPLTAPQSKDSF